MKYFDQPINLYKKVLTFLPIKLNMNKFLILTSLILATMVGGSWGHNCSKVLIIESHGLLNYLGNISFIAPHNISGKWIMEMTTDVEYTFLGGWNIWVTNNPSQGMATFRSRQEDLEIQAGDLITFRFRISWFTGEPEPEVISLIWDGEQICADNGQSVKDIKASRSRRTLNQRAPVRQFGRRGSRRTVN